MNGRTDGIDLARVGPGFDDLARGSQAVFRSVLGALSHPGRPIDVAPGGIGVPPTAQPAAAAVLLALLDADSRVWLSPALAGGDGDAAHWLRFHTGCSFVDTPDVAQFAWVGLGDAAPAFDRFAQGSDADPDQSTTCVLEVSAFEVGDGTATGTGWTLRGPGIAGQALLQVHGLHPGVAAAAFAERWRANHAAFPRGMDLLFASAGQIVGLPRTTRVDAHPSKG